MDGADWRGKAIPRDPTSAQSEFPPFLKKLRKKNDINLLIWNSRYSKYKNSNQWYLMVTAVTHAEFQIISSRESAYI